MHPNRVLPGGHQVTRSEALANAKLRVILLNSLAGWGGGEKWCVEQGLALRARGHQVLIACTAGSSLEAAARERGLSVWSAAFSGPFGGGLAALRLAGLARSEGYQALIANVGRDVRVGALVQRCAGVVLLQRRGIAKRSRKGPFSRWLYRHHVRRVLVNARAIGESLREEVPGLEAERICIVRNGIDIGSVPAGEGWRIRSDVGSGEGPVVLSVARLSAMKGQRDLLAAWQEVRRRFPKAVLLLAGTGEEEAALRTQARELEGVHFLGFRRDVDALYAAADLFVLASTRYEGCSNALLEAMWHGIPAVVTRCGGLPEAVADGETGRVVPPGEPEALAAALVELLQDPAVRTRMGHAAQTRVRERCSLPRVTGDLEAELYATVREAGGAITREESSDRASPNSLGEHS